jgi:transposase-like protein
MKLKKGSLEAKRFMAKIRAKKGKPKKISGVKKPSVKKTHTDIKSHNYKISINGLTNSQIADFKLSKERLKEYEDFLLFNLKELKNKKFDTFHKKQLLYENSVYKKYIKNYKTHINNLKKLL